MKKLTIIFALLALSSVCFARESLVLSTSDKQMVQDAQNKLIDAQENLSNVMINIIRRETKIRNDVPDYSLRMVITPGVMNGVLFYDYNHCLSTEEIENIIYDKKGSDHK